jgi:hypothetical protein
LGEAVELVGGECRGEGKEEMAGGVALITAWSRL